MGINMNDAFPSKWLKASDIQTPHIVTIKQVTMEEVGMDDHDRKPVVWLEEHSKGVVLNKTNASNITSLYGPDTDGWTGKQMNMTKQWVDFQGRSTEAIRLYPPQSGQFTSGLPDTPPAGMNSDPRGDVPANTDPNAYGAARG